jgi:ribosomal protein S18 acetylase RimI-like enzyme
MSFRALHEDGWSLSPTTDTDIDAVMAWFPDAESVNVWGGPAFRYPFTGETFREDCRLDLTDSYCLRDASGELAAFGQSYERCGRGHLARLASNPAMRRRGAGKRLIRMILASLDQRHGYDEYSLFVFRDNEPAYQCYLSLGFGVHEYPDDAPMPDRCYFLTKKRREQ